MDATKPTEAHGKMAALAGLWEGEETMFPSPWDPKGGTARGKYDNRMALGGLVLLIDGYQEKDGEVTYQGHGVFGWDAKKDCYLMHWSDSMSGIAPRLGEGHFDGDKLQFTEISEMGHARFTYTLMEEAHYHFSIEFSKDGQKWMAFMEGRYAKS